MMTHKIATEECDRKREFLDMVIEIKGQKGKKKRVKTKDGKEK